MKTYYGINSEFQGWEKAPPLIASLIAEIGAKRILEVGSGANPILSSRYVRDAAITYVTSDLCAEELEKADPAFERLVLDLSGESVDPALLGTFDIVLSHMVCEHIQDGEQFHRNISSLLRPGGLSVHFVAALGNLPMLANRLIPGWFSDFLQKTFAPRDAHRHRKFKAYYSWSRGPTPAMIQRFQSLGFEVLVYNGYFGHDYYKARLKPLHWLEGFKSRWLVRHPVPQLASYATIILRKR
jgi:SAM-dependent methyltransferase